MTPARSYEDYAKMRVGVKTVEDAILNLNPYKNINGEFETDFIDCSLWNSTAETTAEYCKKGDLVGIKGNLQTSISNNGIKNFNVNVDRITFLASKKKTDDIEQEKDIKIQFLTFFSIQALYFF